MMGTPRLGSLAPGLGTDAPHQPLSDRPHLGHQLERPQEEAHRPAPVSVSDMETILRPSSDPKEEAVRRVAWREPARRQRPSATKPERERKAEPRGIEPTTEDLAVLPRSRKLSKSAWLGLAGAGGTVAVLATLFALWPTAPDIAGAVKTDADGKEKLELTCQGCPDGSTLSVGGVRGSVRGKVTELDAASTLHVGKNEVDVVVEREGGDRDEVPIEVFVNYRIRGDFSGLDASRPKFDVNVEAVPDTVVVVDGKPVKLDSSGKGRVEIDVTKDLTGPKAKMSKLVRAVPYSATASGMEKEEGAVTLSTLVTPLVVTAPGSRTVIGGAHFMLAGKTDQRGTVTVSGRPITVDAQGRFAQLMNVSAVGETTITVRATSPKQAPRLVPIHVKRVQNLSAEAARFRKQATTLYSAIRADLASKKGWKVALTGAVAEIRQADHATVILMNVEDGCERPPCQARLVYGRSTKVAMGSRVEAFGRVIGAHRSRRGDIPDVSVDFLVHAGSP